jgi:hypothetical protein
MTKLQIRERVRLLLRSKEEPLEENTQLLMPVDIHNDMAEVSCDSELANHAQLIELTREFGKQRVGIAFFQPMSREILNNLSLVERHCEEIISVVQQCGKEIQQARSRRLTDC